MPTGKLTIITGPMFSGKTTELLKLYERKELTGVKCMLVKFAGDSRYDEDCVTSHMDIVGSSRSIPSHSFYSISELFSDDIVEYDTIFIDEIQFFRDIDLVEHLLRLDIDVVVSGLNGDWQRKMFPGMEKLFAMAFDIHMFKSICGFCMSENACYTSKVFHNGAETAAPTYSNIDIGGHEKYKASCLNCYLQNYS